MTSTPNENDNNNSSEKIAITFTPAEKETVKEVLKRVLSKTDLLSQSQTLRYQHLLEKFSC
jgi:hypothetical protein